MSQTSCNALKEQISYSKTEQPHHFLFEVIVVHQFVRFQHEWKADINFYDTVLVLTIFWQYFAKIYRGENIEIVGCKIQTQHLSKWTRIGDILTKRTAETLVCPSLVTECSVSKYSPQNVNRNILLFHCLKSSKNPICMILVSEKRTESIPYVQSYADLSETL